VSTNAVPLTVIKGAGDAAIPLPEGSNATVADFHTMRTATESPAHITSGFYKIEAGPERPATYTYEETKYVLSGQIDVFVCFPSSLLEGVASISRALLIMIVSFRTRLPGSPTT
jgi:hypothetical protein